MLAEARKKIRILFYALIGIICILIAFRIILELLGTDSDSPLGGLVFGFTDIFISPFVFAQQNATSSLYVPALISLIFYLIFGVLIVEIITGFIYDSVYEIIQNIIDAFFKILEVLLFLRIILEIFNFSSVIGFVGFINNLTNWSTNLFNNPSFIPINIPVSTIVVLAVVIVLDIFVGNILESMFEFAKEKPSGSPANQREIIKEKETIIQQSKPVNIYVNNYQRPPQTMAQPLPVQSNVVPQQQPKKLGIFSRNKT